MPIPLNDLTTLIAVVEAGTLEAAATALHVTPSAVSQRLRALEESVGRTLIRRTKPIEATESGEVILRLARQVDLLRSETEEELGASPRRGAGPARTRVPIVASADALATWLLPALAAAAEEHDVVLEIVREDQAHSTQLLRDGTVMAAVTSTAEPVPGCAVRRLGAMRYRAMATPAYVRRWFPNGVTAATLALAPVVVFDRKDDLQDDYLRRRVTGRIDPPRHFVPESTTYAAAIRLGLGWGMIPDLQRAPDDGLVALDESDARHGRRWTDVTLYWQQWKLRSTALSQLAAAVDEAAERALS